MDLGIWCVPSLPGLNIVFDLISWVNVAVACNLANCRLSKKLFYTRELYSRIFLAFCGKSSGSCV